MLLVRGKTNKIKTRPASKTKWLKQGNAKLLKNISTEKLYRGTNKLYFQTNQTFFKNKNAIYFKFIYFYHTTFNHKADSKNHNSINNSQARDITGIKSENLVKVEFYKLRDEGLIEKIPELKGPASAWRLTENGKLKITNQNND